jgi:hypothetical protein
LSLGGLLVMIAELQALAVMTKAKACELVIAPRDAALSDNLYRVVDAGGARLMREEPEDSAVTKAALRWPPAGFRTHYDPSSMSRLQDIFERSGVKPRVELRKGLVARAAGIAERLRGGYPAIAVHLKNIPAAGSDASNADPRAWRALFEEFRDRAVFVLVGDDPVPAELLGQPNVVQSRSVGADLCIDLALIQVLDGFMGMSSGLCQMAIFGPKPYAIFKNPRHDAAQMDAELQGRKRFSFACDGQWFLREPETPHVLARHCAALLQRTSEDGKRESG